jgi:starch-binding outer membrane protein, SusD/RagB family
MKLTTKAAGLALAGAALLGAAACNDEQFLTEVPYDFVGPENFYQTQNDALAAIAGVYGTAVQATGDGYYGRNFVMLVEYPTEMQTPYLSASNERSQPDNYTFTPSHNYINSTWVGAYQAINRANSVVERVPAIAMDTTLRRRVVAEAKFLRAMHYFNLVRLFGGVPLRTSETRTLDSLQQPRATAAAVYAQIVADLKDAAAVLPPKAAYSGTDVGRATRGAAKSLLAKVYIQRAGTGVSTDAAGDYTAALALLRDVKANEGYSLVADFGSLFDGTNENNSEVIFDVQCSRSTGIGCRLSNQDAPRLSNYGSGQNGSFTAEQPFFDEFVAADKRRAGTWQLSYTNKSGTLVTWMPVVYTAGTTRVNTTGYATSGTSTTADTSTAPYMGKFLDRQSVSAGNDEPNYVIQRFADNLLLEAEVVNELSGPTADAYAAINAVRQRAGIGSLAAGLSKAAFRDSVFHERRLELAMEGPNGYFDSQRNWAWARARVEANMATGSSLRFRTNRYPKAQTAITDKFRLMPIPQAARDANPRLEQNPGW